MATRPLSTAAPVSRPGFAATLAARGVVIDRKPVTTLQVNVGKRCNQACTHCHVEAGPKRTESMAEDVVARLIELMDTAPDLTTLDVTGGAPELHDAFRPLALAGRARGLRVIDRCNLTVLFEPGQEDTARWLAENEISVVASLPCYTQANVDKQRGRGVFDPSIRALKLLNGLGYGQPDSGLELDLVYNPGGAFLPGPQQQLEADYHQRLGEDFGIVFNQLYTITNMPIKRFRHELARDGALDSYMDLLRDNFNPQAAAGVMCRDLVSVGYDGRVYDCDFNQMLELDPPVGARTVFDIDRLAAVSDWPIRFGSHCFGCTAGAGSSCGGALTA